MLTLGLSAADQAKFSADLVASHAVRVQVNLCDLDHNVTAVASGRVLSGQVDVDATAEVTRSLQLEVEDYDNSLGLDSGGPGASGMYADRMVQVIYGVRSPSLDRWVDVPVFTGPITGLSRSGKTLTITAQGKEVLMMGACGYSQVFPKGTAKTTILRALFTNAGEQFVEIGASPDKQTLPFSVASSDVAWTRVTSLAQSLGGARVVYDGRGHGRLWRPSSTPVWAFGPGEGGLLSEPALQYDQSTVKNLVVVAGGTPKGAKKPIRAQAVAAVTHPFAPGRLGRNGRPRWLREDISDDSIVSQAVADRLAVVTLQDRLKSAVDVSFDCLVVPHLEPLDVVVVKGADWSWSMPVEKFSIPLSGDGRMTVGRHSVVASATRRRVGRR